MSEFTKGCCNRICCLTRYGVTLTLQYHVLSINLMPTKRLAIKLLQCTHIVGSFSQKETSYEHNYNIIDYVHGM